MKQINFIFTKNGFHIDETKEENTVDRLQTNRLLQEQEWQLPVS